MPVKVRIRYPRILEERARAVATIFRGDGIEVELVEDGVEEIVVEGPMFATADITRATALLRRYLIALEKRGLKARA
ncbi:MAG: hypothetical protein F7C35_02025 [Desulfurococcales archaeon]|nr:hypothetical protein [Desulfurococcales archaeon]